MYSVYVDNTVNDGMKTEPTYAQIMAIVFS